jgi:hypothetical protein
MQSYNDIRESYRPNKIRWLLIAESPPPSAKINSSRHFYRSDKVRTGDRLFTNTIKALYPEAAELPESTLQDQKEQWLRRFQDEGWYMIEALEKSLPHEVTKQERQTFIKGGLSHLVERVRRLANNGTKLILIKSNVFDVAAEPLRQAGFTVLNKELLDYPGQFNQRAYREKLRQLVTSTQT